MRISHCLQSLRGCILPTMYCGCYQRWELLHPYADHCRNGRNDSQHCWPSNVESVNDIWNKSYMNCGNEMKMKKWSSQWTQFMQLRKETWKKFRTSTGFEPVISRLPVRLHKLRSLRPSFLHFHFISAVHIWFISYIINTHFFHGNIWTHNWAAPNVSGFIAQMVEHRKSNREVTEIGRAHVWTPVTS